MRWARKRYKQFTLEVPVQSCKRLLPQLSSVAEIWQYPPCRHSDGRLDDSRCSPIWVQRSEHTQPLQTVWEHWHRYNLQTLCVHRNLRLVSYLHVEFKQTMNSPVICNINKSD